MHQSRKAIIGIFLLERYYLDGEEKFAAIGMWLGQPISTTESTGKHGGHRGNRKRIIF
jgi:hypothetical protein